MPYNYATQTVSEILSDLQARITAVEGGTTPIYPGDITDLTATAFSSTQTELAWTPASNAASHEYRVDGGAWTAAGDGSQLVGGLTAETAYTFEVRGVNADGAGNPSNVATATTQAAGATTLTAIEPADRGRMSGSIFAEESGVTTLTLNPRPSQDYENSSAQGLRSQVVFARVSGVQGFENLRIRIPRLTSGETSTGWRASNRAQWRIPGSGWQGWQSFENATGGEFSDKVAWNNAAFAVNEIEVGFNLPMPIADVTEAVADWAATGLAVEPASSVGGGAFAHNYIGGTNYRDDRTGGTLDGISLPQHCLYFTDPSQTPPTGRSKAEIVHLSGVHASEDAFTHALFWAIQEWLENPAARARFNLPVYPTANVSGRYVGRRRGISQITARAGTTTAGGSTTVEGEDANRVFPDPAANQFSEEVWNTIQAFAADDVFAQINATNGAFWDWHTDGVGPEPDIFALIYSQASAAMTSLLAYINPHLPEAVVETATGTDMAGLLAVKEGVTNTATLETGYDVADMPAFVEAVGRGWMKGMIDAYDAGLLGTASQLNALSIVPSTVPQGEAATINIEGATDGSVITGKVPDGLTLNSAAGTITGTPTGSGAVGFTLTERLDGYSNSPRDNSLTLTISTGSSGDPVRTARINFGKPSGPQPVGFTDARGNLGTSANISIVDADGATTGWLLNGTATANGEPGAQTDDDSGIFPDAALAQYLWTDTATITVTISGLDPARNYTLKMVPSRGAVTGRVTRYTCGGSVIDVEAGGNTANAAVFSGVTPNASGVISFTWQIQSGGFCYLNAMEIVEFSA